MNRIFENLYANKELHAVLFGSICEKYDLTLTEILVLLFLKKNKNKESDTATDIVEKLKITKSHVSCSVRDLEERGYIRGIHVGKDRRSIHLQLCDKSTEIIREGEQIQNEFVSIIYRGFSDDELQTLNNYIQRMTENANGYLRDHDYRKGGSTG